MKIIKLKNKGIKKIKLFLMSIIPFGGCPAGCSSPIGPIEANYCDPDTTNAQIPVIYLMALSGASFTDITDPTEWATRLDQNSLDPDKVRTLHVIGSKPLPESTKVDLGNDKFTNVQKTHKLELTIRETGDANYNFLKSTECGGNFKLAYVAGKYMFANSDKNGIRNNDFIEATFDMSDVITENFADTYEFKLTITWKRKFSPDRFINPIA